MPLSSKLFFTFNFCARRISTKETKLCLSNSTIIAIFISAENAFNEKIWDEALWSIFFLSNLFYASIDSVAVLSFSGKRANNKQKMKGIKRCCCLLKNFFNLILLFDNLWRVLTIQPKQCSRKNQTRKESKKAKKSRIKDGESETESFSGSGNEFARMKEKQRFKKLKGKIRKRSNWVRIVICWKRN